MGAKRPSEQREREGEAPSGFAGGGGDASPCNKVNKMKKPILIKVTLKEGVDPLALYGSHDRHIRMLEKTFGVKIGGRGENLIIEGDAEHVQQAEKVILDLAALSKEGFRLASEDVLYAIRAAKHDTASPLEQGYQQEAIPIFGKKKFFLTRSLD